jgi:hypothetical protein
MRGTDFILTAVTMRGTDFIFTAVTMRGTDFIFTINQSTKTGHTA